MSDNYANIKFTQGVQNGSEAQHDAPPPGGLAKFSDNTYEFTGNGETTNSQVMDAVIHHEANGDHPELAPMDGDPEAGRMASVLMGDDPDKAMANGETKTISLKDLINAIEPFLKAWAQNHASSEHGETSSSNNTGGWGATRAAIGLVNNDGISIPMSEPAHNNKGNLP